MSKRVNNHMETYEYFELSEFDCKETGENEMDHGFITTLDLVRDRCGFRFVITSGYRSIKHSKEIIKSTPGQHTKGIAADIRVNNACERYLLVDAAIAYGLNGVGVAKTFVHVDQRESPVTMWVY